MVISGPRSITDLATSAMPTSAAIRGMSQTSDGSQTPRGAEMFESRIQILQSLSLLRRKLLEPLELLLQLLAAFRRKLR